MGRRKKTHHNFMMRFPIEYWKIIEKESNKRSADEFIRISYHEIMMEVFKEGFQSLYQKQMEKMEAVKNEQKENTDE